MQVTATGSLSSLVGMPNVEKINPGEDGNSEQEPTGATMAIGGGFSKTTEVRLP